MKVRTAKLRSASSTALERFVILPENRSARRAVQRWSTFEIKRATRRKSFPLLFLHGPPGTGKSHLVQGAVERIIATARDRSAHVIPARDLGRLLTDIPTAG